jgi:pilus assembly protein Flp/PilA
MAGVGSMIAGFSADEAGATAIEYGMIAALIAVVLIAAIIVLGGEVTGLFNFVVDTAGAAMADAGN